jgi:hypothetical protein
MARTERDVLAAGVTSVTVGLAILVDGLLVAKNWPLIPAALLIVPGVYAIVASFDERLPLPGRAAHEKARQRKDKAIELLVLFHTTCVVARDREVTEDQFQKWFNDLSKFVGDAWGGHQSTALGGGIWSGGNFYRMNEVETRLSRLIERVDEKEVSPTFDPTTVNSPVWLVQETTPGPNQTGRFSGPLPE